MTDPTRGDLDMPKPYIRTIEVVLSPDAVYKYDAARTGKDDDVVLAVEKAIVGRLYPERTAYSEFGFQVNTDPDLVACSGMDS